MSNQNSFFMGFALVVGFAGTVVPAEGGEEVVDLGGSGLFFVPYREPGNMDSRYFEYVVPGSDVVRITNGTMLEYEPVPDLGSTPQDYFKLRVDGTMIFGQGFPEQPCNLSIEQWLPIEIGGKLVFDKSTTINFAGPLLAEWEVASGAEVEVTDGHFLTVTKSQWINNGTITIGDGGGLGVTHFVGNGTIYLGAGSGLSGILDNQTVYAGPGSDILMLSNGTWSFNGGVYQSIIHLPSEGNVRMRYGPGEAMNASELIIADVPSDLPSYFQRIGGTDFPNNPMNNSTVRLEAATGVGIGDDATVLGCVECNLFGGVSLPTLTLEPPTGSGGVSYLLRWSASGLHVLGVPDGWCSADLNFDGVLNFFDVSAFLGFYTAGSPWANMGATANQDFNFFDVEAFLDAYSSGCP